MTRGLTNLREIRKERSYYRYFTSMIADLHTVKITENSQNFNVGIDGCNATSPRVSYCRLL